MTEENSVVLQPGVSIKPKVGQEDVNLVLKNIFGLECIYIKELNGYDDCNYHVRVSHIYNNPFIDAISEAGYIFKIINALDSKKPQLFEAQNELLIYLGNNGICCSKPIQTIDGTYNVVKIFSSGTHLVRLLEFIDGFILYQVPTSINLFYQCGKYVAQLDETLKNFHHSNYDTYKSVWMMDAVPQLTEFIFVITDEPRRKIVEEVVKQFVERVASISQNLERGIIHGDFNEQNILVEQDNGGQWMIKGILDFGDSQKAPYLYELAISMAYMILQGKSIDVGGYVLAGYESVRPVPPQEYDILKVCIASRLCQSLVLGAYTSLQDPENSYILTTSKPGWTLLQELWAQPEDKLLQHWRAVYDNHSN